MGDDNYGAALLAMASFEYQARAYSSSMTGITNYHTGAPNKTDTAIAYLRERKLYCLDSPVGRIPPKERTMTVLDKWMKERHK